MNFIFASDLDQTLIYSSRFLEDFTIEEKEEIDLVEVLDGREISFMSKISKKQIKSLMSKGFFVPVTTRTMAQFDRIKFFSEECKLKYAITSNGGNILINGKISEEWQNIIAEKLTNNSINGEIVLEEFNKIRTDIWAKECKLADELFYYTIIDRVNLPKEALEVFDIWLENNGWNMSIQGRKLYLVPKCVDKWEAVKYIASLENIDYSICAGDSKLDFNMVANSTKGIIPSHGKEIVELVENKKEKYGNIHITESSGILAANEILNKVCGLVENGL